MKENNDKMQKLIPSSDDSEPTYGKIMKSVRSVFGLLSLIFGMMLWTKIDTTMAD